MLKMKRGKIMNKSLNKIVILKVMIRMKLKAPMEVKKMNNYYLKMNRFNRMMINQ